MNPAGFGIHDSRIHGFTDSRIHGFTIGDSGLQDSGLAIHDSGSAIRDQRFCESRYSYRSATRGSTLLARRAGSQTAISATSVSTSGTPANTSGSLAVTPNKKDVISF